MIRGAEHNLVYYVLLRCAGQRVKFNTPKSVIPYVLVEARWSLNEKLEEFFASQEETLRIATCELIQTFIGVLSLCVAIVASGFNYVRKPLNTEFSGFTFTDSDSVNRENEIHSFLWSLVQIPLTYYNSNAVNSIQDKPVSRNSVLPYEGERSYILVAPCWRIFRNGQTHPTLGTTAPRTVFISTINSFRYLTVENLEVTSVQM
jgi:hypothetical protein